LGVLAGVIDDTVVLSLVSLEIIKRSNTKTRIELEEEKNLKVSEFMQINLLVFFVYVNSIDGIKV